MSSRRMRLTEGEQAWVRAHWPLISQLRAALRTEPNVELVVLFGSSARGDDLVGVSDLDLLVCLRRASPDCLAGLRRRLVQRLPVAVQLVTAEHARANPLLMGEIARDGRVVVDRGAVWPRLQADAARVRAQAERSAGERDIEARSALRYFRELAAARAKAPLAD